MTDRAIEPAVFSRNWPDYLEEAVQIGKRVPEQLVTFQSKVSWASARDLLDDFGSMPIYFAPNDGSSMVRYAATLEEILLHPRSRSADARRLLKRTLRSIRSEGIWKEGEGTLYAIAGCHEVARPFRQTRLIKLSDGTPIDAAYSRSYVLTEAHGSTPVTTDVQATDLANPPSRVLTHTYRIIRDTRLIQRLKYLHRDRCQLCGETLKLPGGDRYSEGHHLQPLGGPHRGPDTSANAWQDRDYATIITVACKMPEKVLQEDSKLLIWFDQALTRSGEEA